MVTPLFAQIVFIGGYNVVTPSYFFGFNLHGLVRYIYQNLSETQQLARFLLNKKKGSGLVPPILCKWPPRGWLYELVMLPLYFAKFPPKCLWGGQDTTLILLQHGHFGWGFLLHRVVCLSTEVQIMVTSKLSSLDRRMTLREVFAHCTDSTKDTWRGIVMRLHWATAV